MKLRKGAGGKLILLNRWEMTFSEGVAKNRVAGLDRYMAVVVGVAVLSNLLRGASITRSPKNPSNCQIWALTESDSSDTVPTTLATLSPDDPVLSSNLSSWTSGGTSSKQAAWDIDLELSILADKDTEDTGLWTEKPKNESVLGVLACQYIAFSEHLTSASFSNFSKLFNWLSSHKLQISL